MQAKAKTEAEKAKREKELEVTVKTIESMDLPPSLKTRVRNAAYIEMIDLKQIGMFE